MKMDGVEKEMSKSFRMKIDKSKITLKAVKSSIEKKKIQTILKLNKVFSRHVRFQTNKTTKDKNKKKFNRPAFMLSYVFFTFVSFSMVIKNM